MGHGTHQESCEEFLQAEEEERRRGSLRNDSGVKRTRGKLNIREIR